MATLTAAELQELSDLEEMAALEKKFGANEEPPSIMTPITEEQHPSFSLADRAIVKNLSNDSEASVKYLKQKHPELEIKHQNGRILARKPGEQNYRVLDPETGIDPFSVSGLKEMGKDILDVGYDIPAGLAQGAATTAGAIAGGLGTGGPGALPAGMAASAAAGAGGEALRQGLGKLAGIPQDMNLKDIGMAGAVGAAMPGVLGGGVTRAALQGVGKGLTAEAIQKILQSQKGLLGRGADFVGNTMVPAWGEMAGGINRETTRTLRNKLPEIQKMELSGITGPVEDVHNRLVGGLAQLKQSVGKDLERAITESGKTVDVSKIKAPLEAAITQAKTDAAELGNKGMVERVSSLQKIYDDLFTIGDAQSPRVLGMGEALPAKQEIPTQISAKAAFNLQEQLADLADLHKTGQGPMARFGAGATRSEKKTAEDLRKAYSVVNDELDTATDGLSAPLKAQYREFAMIQKDLQPFFRTPEKTMNTLSSLKGKSKTLLLEKLQGLEEKHGIPLLEDAKLLETFRAYTDPSLMAQSGLGSTSTSRTVPLSIAGGSLGTLLGYKAGGGYSGAAVGGVAGAKLGELAGSPAMTRKLVEAEAALRRQAAKAAPVARPTLFGGGQTAWDVMQQRDE